MLQIYCITIRKQIKAEETNENNQERNLRADTARSNARQHLCHLAPEFASKHEKGEEDKTITPERQKST